MIRQFLTASALGIGLLVQVGFGEALAGQAKPDVRPPTALEQALTAHACTSQGVTEFEAQLQCAVVELQSLRADFGYDLGRVSARDRQALEAACAGFSRPEQRDAHVACLSDRLAVLRSQRARKAAPADDAGAPAPAEAGLPGTTASVDSAAPARATVIRPLVVGASVSAVALAAAAVMLLRRRSRATRHACRSCGASVVEAGDLCAGCRHQAAEARRQAAFERADHERAQAEQERLQHDREEREEEARRQRVPEAEQAPLESAAVPAPASRVQPPANVPPQSPPAAAPPPAQEVFDPYAVLGVSPDTPVDGIRAAYESARQKYDETVVEHLGDDVREHFRAKAAAVERARQILMEKA